MSLPTATVLLGRLSAEEIQTNLKTQDGSIEYTAYEAVEFAINLTLTQNHCAGDSITISVPEELGTDTDFTPIPMTTPGGNHWVRDVQFRPHRGHQVDQRGGSPWSQGFLCLSLVAGPHVVLFGSRGNSGAAVEC